MVPERRVRMPDAQTASPAAVAPLGATWNRARRRAMRRRRDYSDR